MWNDRRLKMLRIADCELYTEDGQTFPAHKSILANESDFFASIFRSYGSESTRVSVQGLKGETLRNVLSHIYNGKLTISEENLCDLILASHTLLLPDILDKTKKGLEEHLTFSNCIAVFTAANSINQVDVARRSKRFIELHFENIVRKAKNFHEMPLEEMILLLKDRSLRVTNENTVWLTITEWVEADLPVRLSFVPELLKCLATGDVSKHLGNEILAHDIISKNKFCKKISDLKVARSNFNLSQILQDSLLSNPEINPFSYTYRNPPTLHFFSCVSEEFGRVMYVNRVYITYDDKIDLWRKVLEIYEAEQILPMNGSIYVFGRFELRRYSVVDEEWYPCANCVHEGEQFVTLGRFIYVLGFGMSSEDPLSSSKHKVSIYDPEIDHWHETSAMFPIGTYEASVLNDCIYIVGHKSDSDTEMIAQVYKTSEEVWSFIPAPTTLKAVRSLVAYRGKIYAIGGTKEGILGTVEAFDPSQNVWKALVGLPYPYNTKSPERDFGINVINDHLIVSGQHHLDCCVDHLFSTVMWNEDGQCWEILQGPSPNCKLCFYSLYSLEDSEMVNRISKKNKNPGTVFEKTPFGDIYL